jgi:hypothetical protein
MPAAVPECKYSYFFAHKYPHLIMNFEFLMWSALITLLIHKIRCFPKKYKHNNNHNSLNPFRKLNVTLQLQIKYEKRGGNDKAG